MNCDSCRRNEKKLTTESTKANSQSSQSFVTFENKPLGSLW